MANDKKDGGDLPGMGMPSLVGFTPAQLQTLLGTLGMNSAQAMKDAIRSQRKENPSYPERSVFNPGGVFDDEGVALPPKVKLSRETFYVGVRLSEELMTVDEIELCNRFKVGTDKYSRDGLWKAEFRKNGSTDRLFIVVPCKNNDDRMVLPPFANILRELLLGPDAVNPESMQKQIDAMAAEIKALKGTHAQVA